LFGDGIVHVEELNCDGGLMELSGIPASDFVEYFLKLDQNFCTFDKEKFFKLLRYIAMH
jgi:hypothetical protein